MNFTNIGVVSRYVLKAIKDCSEIFIKLDVMNGIYKPTRMKRLVLRLNSKGMWII